MIETGAGQGGEACDRFEDIAAIIDQVHDKSRVGVCFDTCHVVAAGYDVRTSAAAVMREFDEVVGFDYLMAFHVNDSHSELI